MKNKHSQLSLLRLLVLFSSVAILFTSCDSYNFSQPQPVDKSDIYEFPDEFPGRWETDTFTSEIEFTVPVKADTGYSYINHDDNFDKAGPYVPAIQSQKHMSDDDGSFYYFTRHYVLLIFPTHEEKIVTGAWPKLKNGKEFIYPNAYPKYNILKTIKYDSLKQAIDTVDNFIFNKDKIHEKDSDLFLYTGYRYYKDKDTIVVLKSDTVCIDLGQNAFLRKLNDTLYAFNINNSILGLSEENKWWRIVILGVNKKGKLVQWEPSSKTAELSCMFYDRPSKSDIFYFDCQWTTAEMLRLIKDGYFEISSVCSKTGN